MCILGSCSFLPNGCEQGNLKLWELLTAILGPEEKQIFKNLKNKSGAEKTRLKNEEREKLCPNGFLSQWIKLHMRAVLFLDFCVT